MSVRVLRWLIAVLLLFLFVSCRQREAELTSPAVATTVVPTATRTPSPTRTPRPTLAPDGTEQTPRPTRTTEPGDSARPFDSPEYGVQLFMWWKPDIAQRDLQLTKEMGFGWVKQSFAWRDIETHEKGAHNWWHSDTIVQA